MNRWFVDALRPTNDVVVVDAGELNLKSLGKKTDRRDAYEIARRLRLGDIDKNAKTYYPTDEEYGLRKILRTRNGFTKMKQQVVNQIRALLRNFRIPQPENALTPRTASRLSVSSLGSRTFSECAFASLSTSSSSCIAPASGCASASRRRPSVQLSRPSPITSLRSDGRRR